jgi:hypothetical protein
LIEEKRRKEVLDLSRELGELDAAEPTTLGAALDAGERSGPRWTGDAWLARRRRYSTARRDRAHNIMEAEGRAGTLRFTQRSSNTRECRVNVRVNDIDHFVVQLIFEASSELEGVDDERRQTLEEAAELTTSLVSGRRMRSQPTSLAGGLGNHPRTETI